MFHLTIVPSLIVYQPNIVYYAALSCYTATRAACLSGLRLFDLSTNSSNHRFVERSRRESKDSWSRQAYYAPLLPLRGRRPVFVLCSRGLWKYHVAKILQEAKRNNMGKVWFPHLFAIDLRHFLQKFIGNHTPPSLRVTSYMGYLLLQYLREFDEAWDTSIQLLEEATQEST